MGISGCCEAIFGQKLEISSKTGKLWVLPKFDAVISRWDPMYRWDFQLTSKPTTDKMSRKLYKNCMKDAQI